MQCSCLDWKVGDDGRTIVERPHQCTGVARYHAVLETTIVDNNGVEQDMEFAVSDFVCGRHKRVLSELDEIPYLKTDAWKDTCTQMVIQAGFYPDPENVRMRFARFEMR